MRNGCTYHGLAVNVAMDLAPFADIDPCGYPGLAVTQLGDLGVPRARRGCRRRARARESRPHLALAASDSMSDSHHERNLPSNTAGVKHKGDGKTARIPDQDRRGAETLKKPDWIRVRAGGSPRFHEIKRILREHNLHTVCEEASLPEHRRVLRQGHRDVHDHGRHLHAALPVLRRRPRPAAAARRGRARQPRKTIAALRLKYVVITSVDRDDLRDGGAQHFVDCIRAVREHSPADADRGAGPRFPRPPRARARHPRGRAART